MENAVKQHIIATALMLFKKYGVRATGVDRIIRESGIAKSTLYYHFKTKDDLICATLDALFKNWRGELNQILETTPIPIQQIYRFFELYTHLIRDDRFYGAVSFNAVVEYAQNRTVLSGLVIDIIEYNKQFLFNAAQSLNVENPKCLADQLSLISSGLVARSMANYVGLDDIQIHNMVNYIIQGHAPKTTIEAALL